MELESNFKTSVPITEHKPEYNALEDRHALHYFANRPVKKHLKRLIKVPGH